jgi:hypothetical protein
MAFESKDGKKFSMSSRRNAHDAGNRVKEDRMSVNMDKDAGTMLATPEEEQPMGEEQDGAAIAQEHGPAMETHTMHPPEEGGMHHVHSVHPDGHEHHSDHGSKEEAHEHAKKLAGIGSEEQEEPAEDSGYEEEPSEE